MGSSMSVSLSGTKRSSPDQDATCPTEQELAPPPRKKRIVSAMTEEALALRRQAKKWLHVVVHADKWDQESHYLMPWPKDLPQQPKFAILGSSDCEDECPISRMMDGPSSNRRGSEEDRKTELEGDQEEGDGYDYEDWGDWMKEHMNFVGGWDLGGASDGVPDGEEEASRDPDYPNCIHGVYHYEC